MFLTFPTASSRQKSWQTVLETVDNMRTGDASFLNGKSLFNFHYPKPIWNSGSTLDESTSTLIASEVGGGDEQKDHNYVGKSGKCPKTFDKDCNFKH